MMYTVIYVQYGNTVSDPVEADTPEDAVKKSGNYGATLCHQCSDLELSDGFYMVYDEEDELVLDESPEAAAQERINRHQAQMDIMKSENRFGREIFKSLNDDKKLSPAEKWEKLAEAVKKWGKL